MKLSGYGIYTKKTMPIIFGLLILSSISGFQFIPMTLQPADALSEKIVGYFPYWKSAHINSIEYYKITNIIYFHIWPNMDGSLNTDAININDLNTITERAHATGVKVTVAVGGWGASDGFPLMTQDPTARANFVSNITDFILTNNLDGVDINWETPINQTKIDSQDILLTELADTLHPLGKTITLAVSGSKIDLKTNDSIDWIHVMAYDMNWNNAEHSTFDDSVSALKMYEDIGIPKDKLVLGMPFYGRAEGWISAMNYQEIVSLCNPMPSENYCDNHFFNGIDLVQQKTQYVLNNNYGGVMIWNLAQDTHDKTSLLNSINDIVLDIKKP
jgi:GH18 family chitinase